MARDTAAMFFVLTAMDASFPIYRTISLEKTLKCFYKFHNTAISYKHFLSSDIFTQYGFKLVFRLFN